MSSSIPYPIYEIRVSHLNPDTALWLSHTGWFAPGLPLSHLPSAGIRGRLPCLHGYYGVSGDPTSLSLHGKRFIY